MFIILKLAKRRRSCIIIQDDVKQTQHHLQNQIMLYKDGNIIDKCVDLKQLLITIIEIHINKILYC